MRISRSTTGPFRERPYYKPEEIEDICSEALRRAGLYPSRPEPVRIERFVEKHFGVTPVYDALPDGVFGYTRFGPRGVEEIMVSTALAEQDSKVAERQINSTMAHEAGHGLLQAHLFVLERERLTSLFGEDLDPTTPKILCREPVGVPKLGYLRYDGRWWEFQANRAIGALLLPKPLVLMALSEFLVPVGSLGQMVLDPQRREEAARSLAEIFDVNPVVARIRIQETLPEQKTGQLTL